jgi:hypothetical protein
MDTMNRRLALGLLAGTAASALLPRAAAAAPKDDFTMWRDPGCGCCTVWAQRVEAAFGRKLRIVDSGDMVALKAARGVPEDLRSCHTASIGGYTIEGHVPPADIQRLVKSKSRTVRGLAVPGMPAGSPGMDVGHDRKQAYTVFAFGPAGRRSAFARHNGA